LIRGAPTSVATPIIAASLVPLEGCEINLERAKHPIHGILNLAHEKFFRQRSFDSLRSLRISPAGLRLRSRPNRLKFAWLPACAGFAQAGTGFPSLATIY